MPAGCSTGIDARTFDRSSISFEIPSGLDSTNLSPMVISIASRLGRETVSVDGGLGGFVRRGRLTQRGRFQRGFIV